MLSDGAITQGSQIKRHFVFFSSLTLSAETSSSVRESEREGDRMETEIDVETGGDDGVADRQVAEQPAAPRSAR